MAEHNDTGTAQYSSLDEYRSVIENLADNKESMAYANAGPEHAAIVFANIFRTSNTLVNVFAGNMNGGISSSKAYLEQLNGFLERKGKLRIILQEFDRENNKELFALLKRYAFFHSDQVKVYRTDSTILNTDTNTPIHFCTGDNTMYRMEQNTSKFFATGSFNDPKWVSSLKELFASIKDTSTEVAL